MTNDISFLLNNGGKINISSAGASISNKLAPQKAQTIQTLHARRFAKQHAFIPARKDAVVIN